MTPTLSDLAPLALDLACWGTQEGALAWLDAPPAPHLAQARELLAALGALDAAGRATPAGRRMAELGMHPRLAHMLLAAVPLGGGTLACELAAILAERDVARTRPGERDADLRKRVELLHGGSVAGLEADRAAVQRARRLAGIWARQLHADAPAPRPAAAPDAGLLLAFAYPDRIGCRRSDGARYLLSNGRGAAFAGPDALASEEFLVIAELDAGEREARIYLAAPLARADLVRHCAARLQTVERIEWDRREQAVVARRERRLGALVIDESPARDAARERLTAAMLAGVRELGLAALPWTAAAHALRARLAFLHRLYAADPGNPWPDVSDEALLATLEEWLAPFLDGVLRRDHLARLDLAAILAARLDYPARQALERLAPTHLEVPSGSRIAIDYAGATPTLAVRLQEMFGLTATPTVGGGRVPLTIELLSPAGRPVQVTRDLVSFWQRGYPQVRKELKGRYPRHHWPDDPLAATPTARARPRR
jgi:ATP-dependent helicase HrpB